MIGLSQLKRNRLFYQNQHIRVLFDKDSNPWFFADAICEILQLREGRKIIKKYIPADCKIILNQIQDKDQLRRCFVRPPLNAIFISESGLYRLIFRSQSQAAQTFQTWVLNEVLPCLRKTGYCSLLRKRYQNQMVLLDKKIQEITLKKARNDLVLKRQSDKRLRQFKSQIILEKWSRIRQIENLKRDVIMKPQNKELIHQLVIMKMPDDHVFYAIRCQRKKINYRVRQIKTKFPEAQRILTIEYNTNAINFYNKMKEQCLKNWRGNYFKYISKEALIDRLRDLIIEFDCTMEIHVNE